MKDFFKYMMATICGIVVLSLIGGLLLVLTFMGILAGSDSKKKAPENSVFVLKLEGTVDERADDLSPLLSMVSPVNMDQYGLDDILKAIRLARNEENIKGIYLEGGTATFDSPATAQQIRDALADFQKSGKWVMAYADQYMQTCYYLCSVADSLFLNSTGMIDFKGMGDKNMYWTGLYEKLGIKYQVARVGKYKSYVESETRKDMSEEDREQRIALWGGIWKQMTEQIAESRKTTAAQLDQLANDSILLFASTDDYVAARLIDRTFYPDEMQNVIRRQLKIDQDEEISQLTLKDMLNLKPAKKVREKGEQVAVYYAYGQIVDDVMDGFYSGHNIVGREMSADLKALADDDQVKAVVIRVNSPGGSAAASEQIWHAIQLLKQEKPVVISMGGVAASGGYMISCGSDYIFAEPSTITGSIGIFGMIPNFNGLVTQKLGITWDGAVTNKYTDYETNLVFGDENSDEMRYLQSYTDRGYEQFLSIVAGGRGMTKDEVNEIAQGRVWLATDALDIKLVDELGSLNDAVKKAAKLAKLDEYHTASYPEEKEWLDQLMDDKEKPGTYLDAQLKQMLGDFYEPVMQLREEQLCNRLQARLPFPTSVQ